MGPCDEIEFQTALYDEIGIRTSTLQTTMVEADDGTWQIRVVQDWRALKMMVRKREESEGCWIDDLGS